jgi:Gram-negative bacterial TonB protein C-terminal
MEARAAVAAVMGVAVIGAAKPVVLERSGPWRIDYAAQRCTLSAGFALPPGSKGIAALVVSQTAQRDRFQLAIVHPDLKSDAPIVTGKVRLGDPGNAETREFVVGKLGTAPAVFLSGARLGGPAPPEDEAGDPRSQVPAAVEAATTYVQANVGSSTLRFVTGPLDKPFAALHKCTEDLIASWGYPAAVVAAWQTRARPVSQGKWLSDEDFPKGMLAARANGLVEYRLDIDSTGAVTRCVVLVETNPPGFGVATCEALAKRAHFTPAIGAAGRPERSFYVGSVHYRS